MNKIIFSTKFKKGDVLRFRKSRVELARERRNRKWDEFVLSHIDAPLTIKYTFEKTGNHEPYDLIIVEGIDGYWNQDAFEFYNNFDEGLFEL